LGDHPLLLRHTLVDRREPGFDLTSFLLDLGELTPHELPGCTLVLPEVVDQALLLLLKGAQLSAQSVAFRDGSRIGTLLLAPLQLGRY
jgi:hypothetical protein